VPKNSVHPSTKLRTNGGWIEIIGEFPFVLTRSTSGFFQRPASETLRLVPGCKPASIDVGQDSRPFQAAPEDPSAPEMRLARPGGIRADG